MTEHRSSRPGSLSDRATARAVGALYIVGTVAGASSLAVAGGSLEGPDYLADAASLGESLAVGAFLILVMGLSLAGIPLLVFPILRATSERLALGYVVFRGALETTMSILIALSWFLLFRLATDSAADASPTSADGEALYLLGDTAGTIGTIVFVGGAAMFYWVLWRAQLVPRWLSGWGLVALVPYGAVAVLGLLGTIDVMSSAAVAVQLPLAVQEMVLALWLIIRGFSLTARAAAVATPATSSP
jgi:hypothetical protein